MIRRSALLAWLGVWLCCCAPALAEVTSPPPEVTPSENASPGITPPALSQDKSASDFGGQTVLIVHYRRDKADYNEWNLWAWTDQAEGQAYQFTGSDAFGVYATAVYEQPHQKLGFIVRKGDWEAKDGEQDRLVEVNKKGIAEVWVEQDRMSFDTTPPTVDKAQDVRPATPEADAAAPGEDYTPIAPPSAEALGAKAVAVIHYHRPDGRYDDWDVWGWADGRAGKAYGFDGRDAFGAYARVLLQEPTDRVGFIIRQGDWQERESEGDRFVAMNENGVGEVWLLAGEDRVYMDPKNLDYSLRIQRAFLDAPDRLHVRLNRPATVAQLGGEPADGKPAGYVEAGDERYPVETIKQVGHGEKGSRDMALTLAEPIALKHIAEAMALNLPGLDRSVVFARDVLVDPYFQDPGASLGSEYGPDGTMFATWSPVSERVELLLFKEASDTEPYETHAMSKGTGGVWRVRVEGDLDGVYYQYRFTSYGQQRDAADIYCRAATKDSSKSMVIDLDRTDPPGWDQDKPPIAKSPVDEVIYEVHVRDYSIADKSCPAEERGKFLGLVHKNDGKVKTGISHLKELGVTTVHLLPIQDFTASMDEYNWGYWTALFNVPEAQYSTNYDDPAQAVKDCKAMIQALHEAGIRVVLDVVYNHTSTSFAASPFDQAVPWYYFRTTPGGRLRNESGTGNAVADERPMVRKYIIDSLVYWVKEYHVDGFRFDLLGMMHKQTVAELEKALHAIRPDLLIYGEPWTGGGPTHFAKGDQKKMHVAVFNDHFRNAIRGDLDGVALGFAMGGGHVKEIRNGLAGAIDDFAYNPTESINYVSAHDNRTLWDKLTHTLPSADDQTKRAIQKLSLGLVVTAQGVPFLHGGSDFCRTKLGNHNSYDAGDEVNQFDWPRKAAYRDVFDYVKGLIALRKAHPAFRMSERKQVRADMTFHDGDGPLWFELDGKALGDDWSRIIVAYNGDTEARTLHVPEGVWRVAVDAEHAGVEPIGEVTGEVGLPPYSMMVLYQE